MLQLVPFIRGRKTQAKKTSNVGALLAYRESDFLKNLSAGNSRNVAYQNCRSLVPCLLEVDLITVGERILVQFLPVWLVNTTIRKRQLESGQFLQIGSSIDTMTTTATTVAESKQISPEEEQKRLEMLCAQAQADAKKLIRVPHRRYICHLCWQPGHFRSDCPLRAIHDVDDDDNDDVGPRVTEAEQAVLDGGGEVDGERPRKKAKPMAFVPKRVPTGTPFSEFRLAETDEEKRSTRFCYPDGTPIVRKIQIDMGRFADEKMTLHSETSSKHEVIKHELR